MNSRKQVGTKREANEEECQGKVGACGLCRGAILLVSEVLACWCGARPVASDPRSSALAGGGSALGEPRAEEDALSARHGPRVLRTVSWVLVRLWGRLSSLLMYKRD